MNESERHFRLGAYHGDSGAYFELALNYLYGVRVDRDPKEALRLLKKAVSCRNIDAFPHDVLGDIYLFGDDGVAQDVDQAMLHFKRASDFGYEVAQCRLGDIYSGDSRYRLGDIYTGYLRNCENRKDMTKAIRYYRLAASNGDMDACVKMGIFLRDGREVEKDLAEAVAYFRRAAESRHRFGSVLLCLCYLRGEGVERDLAEAMRLFREVEL